MSIFYIADHDINDYQGGAEKVDYNIYSYLNISYIKSNKFIHSTNDFYIISNALHIDSSEKEKLFKYKNYIIFEHDYKIHHTRQPHLFNNYLFPKNEIINRDYYSNAIAVLVQSKDHLNCYLANGISANFINLSTSIWSEDELSTLEKFTSLSKKTYKACIIANRTEHKGRDIAEAICKQMKIDYDIIPSLPLLEFYSYLSTYPLLINTPRVKESFCRLIVEARCLSMNVISHLQYGAMSEDWYCLSGIDLIKYLKTKTIENIKLIKSLYE